MRKVQFNSTKDISKSTFGSSRLTLARKLRRMTMKDLAKAIGVTPDAVSKYEKADNFPSLEIAHNISRALQMDISFFYGDEINEQPQAAFSFRSLRAMTVQVRDTAIAYSEIARDLISPELHRRYKMPIPDIPDLSDCTPEDAAETLRASWMLGNFPISNLVHLLESKGVEIYWFYDPSPYVDALSFQYENKYFIMLNKKVCSGDRNRFNVAHELGHLVLHQDRNSVGDKEAESQAHRFAGALLLPQHGFRQDCPRQPVLEHFFKLKQKWGVSIAAMIRRGYDLGIYSQWQYHNAYRELSMRGWRYKEPDECAIPVETSLLHQKVFSDLDSKGITPLGFARYLSLDEEIIVDMMPLSDNISGDNVRLRLVK